MTPSRALIGFKVHTGWAAYVAVSADSHGLRVLRRGRAELLPSDESVARFVYHHAAELSASAANDLVQHARRESRKFACAIVDELNHELQASGISAAGCGIIISSATLKSTNLSDILRAHTSIHAAEGKLYQDAVIAACERAGLPVTTVRERDLWTGAAQACGSSVSALQRAVDALRKTVGAPWAADQKSATAAALIALPRSRLHRRLSV